MVAVTNLVVCALALTSVCDAKMNAFLIAVDDLRPLFGSSFGVEEVLTPNIDKFFMTDGSAMQRSYVQIAVCGPSRASILTGRRPDTTRVGMESLDGIGFTKHWCWCQRTDCKVGELFMTVPTYLAKNGMVTTGNGKVFHPDACTRMRNNRTSFGFQFDHAVGDDFRAWNYGLYGVEGRATTAPPPLPSYTEQFSEEQFGTIPGPLFPQFNGTQGVSWMRSPLSDEEQVDGQLATQAVERFANLSRDCIGKGTGKPFFHAVGFHKPHLPHIVPSKYFDLYDINNISLPPNPYVPVGMKIENWRFDGNKEMASYTNNKANFSAAAGFGFDNPLHPDKQRELRLAYFAATSFLDAQVGRVLDGLTQYGYKENTVVVLWSDHGWHLGDTNSWCKMTNFETATRNTLLWRVPGQSQASMGRNYRLVEMVDFFPTLIDLLELPALPKCEGVDQPPTVECLQGESYASEFGLPNTSISSTAPKSYAFSQWPYPASASAPYDYMRSGYTVRTATGYRFTEYVPYLQAEAKGVWNGPRPHDMELYDYNIDPHETMNLAGNASYASVVKFLKTVLRQQYVPQ